MKTQLLAIAALSAAAATPATAQQINGATISAAFQSIEGDFTGDFDATSFAAGLDFGITPSFAIGGSIENISFDEFDDDIFVATARGMYTTPAGSAFGAYYSIDETGDFETTLYGVEGAFKSATTSFEAYWGVADSDVFGDLDVLSAGGFSFEFAVGAGVSLGLDYQAYKVEDFLTEINTGEITDATIGDIALTARYSFIEGASVYAKAGRISASGDSDEEFTRILSVDDSEYITIGAQYDFEGGALFDARTLASYGG
ncbi:hypothetical protein BC777_0659 [Yoonia maricola]|uniref:Uncharacterized protein n=1 Tax=Yoonia maricola TaxID=420999 RepID=A0A2M8WLM3_9RHOB|nr:hypothetical protein [Yoonia maricola]PJI91819.1 hypothetical protein BC777_0659 [Yoonia maricola]